MAEEFYIGLMSGTSMDGIDAALMAFGDDTQRLIHFTETPWPPALARRLRDLCTPGEAEIDRLGPLDAEVAEQFAGAVAALLRQAGMERSRVRAIGSHGQTIRHRPHATPPFTLQIGDPGRLAERTGITVVADFRRRDMAAGGQGAPLVPAYHATWFRHPGENRALLNIGGIANLTLLPAASRQPVSGFDTGPGNTLLDQWIRRQRGKEYDRDGRWAASGRHDQELLEQLLADPYFATPPPKSTGPEYFDLAWLERHLKGRRLPPEQVQATLIQLTAQSVANTLSDDDGGIDRLICCGGGVHNPALMAALRCALPGIPVETSNAYGIGPDQMEAAAFAWLARQTLHGRPGNLPSVTGATHPVILGGIYPAGPARA